MKARYDQGQLTQDDAEAALKNAIQRAGMTTAQFAAELEKARKTIERANRSIEEALVAERDRLVSSTPGGTADDYYPPVDPMSQKGIVVLMRAAHALY